MTSDPVEVGGESHGSIAWSLFTHHYVPGLNWVLMAILLVTLVAAVVAVGGIVIPRRLRRVGLILASALAQAGPLFGLLAAAMVLRQMAINQIDGDPTAFQGEQTVATGVAAMSFMLGLCAGLLGVTFSTVLKLVGGRQADQT